MYLQLSVVVPFGHLFLIEQSTRGTSYESY
jgi:hypothetical protein